ncbi:chromosomal serine/threonine-protein kinase JIL-1 [Musca vetustissima]|uniref:chromosomal serine/threonine-protein kinase JIL-1 n=1 Tax=Musca vetustissima TaxID=27455 RepID=UPI002AB62E70|nr:chromosomal serine/threonine-protein kinase JIL-1 [Musca vetustissima]
MSRYHNSTSKASSSYNNYSKMSNRRQMEHESGYYEDTSEDAYGYSGGGGGSKRIRQRSNEVAKYNKRQKVYNNQHSNSSTTGVGVNLTKRSSKDITNSSSSSTTSRNIYANNNNNIYDQHTDHQQRKIAASYQNYQNSTKISSSANYNHNNNNNLYNNVVVGSSSYPKMTPSSGSNEIVEVPDSDNDDDTTAAANSTKPNKMKNGGGGSVTSNGSHGKSNANVPTFIVNGSSSGSNSNHSSHNYAVVDKQQQQASGSKTTANGTKSSGGGGGSSSKADKKPTDNTAANNGQNNSGSDVERLQREIEEVTQVHTNYVVKQEEQVDLSHFKLIRVLGTGAYGKVFLVRKLKGKDKDQLYAMKVLKKDTVVQKKKTAEHTTTERQVLEAIQQSPFLVGLHYAFQTDSKLYLVLDYVSGGELFTHLYKAEHFSESTVRVYIAEVVLALEHLHKLGIIYRDIKLENILLDGQGHIVLADFGLSKIFAPDSDHRAHSFCGTLEYMAPEIIRAGPNGHDLAVDWWSVGVLTYELLTGASPFTVVEQQNSQSDISRRIQKVDPVLPPTLGEHVKDFILKMLHKDPKKRLGGNSANATEIKNHPFFRGINWNELKSKRRKAPFKPALDSEDDTQNFSEEFTKQPAIDSPAPVPANTHRLFRGYSYVAPQHRSKVEPEIEMQCNFYLEYCNKSVLDPLPAPNSIQLKELCSSGAFGKCYLGWDELRHSNVAVKIIPSNKYRPSELDALISCAQDGHKCIAQHFGAYRNGSDIWLVQEYVPGCELSDYIVQHDEGMDELSCLHVIVQMLDALQHVHKRQFIHGDLKPENIIFAGNDISETKLVDFGAACYHGDMESWSDSPRFTIDYAPPEMLEDPELATYSKAVDIWCLGTTLYTMYMGHSPFRRGREDRAVSLEVHRQRILSEDFYMESKRWQQASSELQNLIRGCLEKDASKRLTLLEIVDHSWFQILHEQMQEEEEEVEEQQVQQIKCETIAEEEEEVEDKQQIVEEKVPAPLSPIAEIQPEQQVAETVSTNHLKLESIAEENEQEEQQQVQEEKKSPNETKNVSIIDLLDQSNSKESEPVKEVCEKHKTAATTTNKNKPAKTRRNNRRAVQKFNDNSTSSPVSSDLEDFCGFDENTPPPTTKQLNALITSLASLRRCKRTYMTVDEQQPPLPLVTPVADAPAPAATKIASTRYSVRNVQPLNNNSNASNRRATSTIVTNKTTPPPSTTAMTTTNDNNKLSKLDSKSITISSSQRNIKKLQPPATGAVVLNKKRTGRSAAVSSLIVESVVTDVVVENDDDNSFQGFTDTLKCKQRLRAFNLMLHHAQVALKHFNIERRVYKNRNSSSGRQSLEQQQQRPTSVHKEAHRLSSTHIAPPQSVGNGVSGRRQPARSTRAQRARYVFE